jgi:hypothetical protein
MAKPPKGWASGDYYLKGEPSYGGTHGKCDGQVNVMDHDGNIVRGKTWLEKMLHEDKYTFIKEHNHTFTVVVGVPYFNPYGKVLLDKRLTKIICKPQDMQGAHVLIGQLLDYSEYLEACVSTKISCSHTVNDLFCRQ